MAEGLFRRAMPDRAVCSAGLGAMVGDPADPLAIQLMAERGIDIAPHRAQNLAGWMVMEADLILTMDREQTRTIQRLYPEARSRVRRLGEEDNVDIPDPYGQGMRAFRHASNLIAAGVYQLAEGIRAGEQKRAGNEFSLAQVGLSPMRLAL